MSTNEVFYIPTIFFSIIPIAIYFLKIFKSDIITKYFISHSVYKYNNINKNDAFFTLTLNEYKLGKVFVASASSAPVL